MGWLIGHDSKHGGRWIGYGVPAYCDHPGCHTWIDRGLSQVCAQEQPYGGDNGCGLYFCADHLFYHEDKDEEKSGLMCERCVEFHERTSKKRCKDFSFKPFTPTPEHPNWIKHLLKDRSWKKWRAENAEEVIKLTAYLEKNGVFL